MPYSGEPKKLLGNRTLAVPSTFFSTSYSPSEAKNADNANGKASCAVLTRQTASP